MKKSYLIIGMAGALLAPNLHATISTGTVILDWSPNYPNNGGPFEASITSTPIPTGVPTSTFDTFCVSINTTFSPGSTYNFVVSPTIVANGGLSSVSLGAATIYHDYLQGDFSFAQVQSGAVQAAIWYYQGLLGGNNGYIDPEGNVDLGLLVASVQSAPGISGVAGLTNPSGGLYDIYALDLYNSDGTPAQPQLIDPTPLGLTPVPEASTLLAGALMLLPFGVSTIRIMRKKIMA